MLHSNTLFTKGPEPKHISRPDTRDVDGQDKAQPCTIKARANRPFMLHFHRLDTSDTIDLSEAEFKNVSHVFEKDSDNLAN